MFTLRSIIGSVAAFDTPPPAFSPAALPGTQLWVSSDGPVVTEDDAGTLRLLEWTDQSSQDNHLIQPIVANRPAWLLNQINGHPAADFATSHWLTSILTCAAMFPVSTAEVVELFIVYSPKALLSSNHLVNINQAATTNVFQVRYNTTDLQVAYRDTINALTAGVVTTSPTVGSWAIVRAQRRWVQPDSLGIVTLWLDGAQAGQNSNARQHVLTTNGDTPLTMGGRTDGTNTIDGKVAALWVGNQELSTTQGNDMHNFLSLLFGL